MVPLLTLLFLYMLHTTGELFLSPIGLSMVTKLAPKNIAGTAMGGWFLSFAIANYAGGLIATLTGWSWRRRSRRSGHDRVGNEDSWPEPIHRCLLHPWVRLGWICGSDCTAEQAAEQADARRALTFVRFSPLLPPQCASCHWGGCFVVRYLQHDASLVLSVAFACVQCFTVCARRCDQLDFSQRP